MPARTVPRQVDAGAPAAGTTFDVIDPSDARPVVARVPAMPSAEIAELHYATVHRTHRWRDTLPIERVQAEVAVRTASAS